jgi:hypothetical protein
LNPAAASSLFGSPTQSSVGFGSMSGYGNSMATGTVPNTNQSGPAAASTLFGAPSAASSPSTTIVGAATQNSTSFASNSFASTAKSSAAPSALFGEPTVAKALSGSVQANASDLSQLQIFDSRGLRNAQSSVKAKLGEGKALQGFVNQKAASPIEMTLKQGSMLFASDRPVKLKTGVGQISIAARAIALVVATPEGVALYNLHDDRGGEVSVNGTALALGEHVLLTRGHDRNYEDVNPLGFITHTNLSSENLANGYQMIRSDFSIMSALSGLKPALQLGVSSDPDNKLAVRLIKNAAILMQIKSGSPYRRMSSDREMLSMQP